MDLKILFKLTQILEDIFDVPSSDITPETDIYEDLGADEFDMVEISMILEEEFDITPDEEDFGKISTVGELCNYVENF